jgi:hypothetical protein
MRANPNPVSPKTHPARNAARSATNGEVLSTGQKRERPRLVTPKRGRSRRLVIELL